MKSYNASFCISLNLLLLLKVVERVMYFLDEIRCLDIMQLIRNQSEISKLRAHFREIRFF